jgi:TolB protein
LDIQSHDITQLTYTDANNTNPSWHPDGIQFVFDSDISGIKQVYILNPEKQANRKLINREIQAFDGRLNSHSNLLVFVGKGPNEKHWNIYSYDFIYNNLNKITYHNSNCQSPRWSPDAAYISYYKQIDYQTFEPAIIHWYGKSAFDSALDQPNMHGINWSPDGYKIVYVTKSDDQFQLYISRRNGTEKLLIASSSFKLSQPDWSPDGSRIVFCVDEGYGKQNLWLINLLE